MEHSTIYEALAQNFNISLMETKSTMPKHKLPLEIGNNNEIIANLAEGKTLIEELQSEWEQEHQNRKIDNQSVEISLHRISMLTGTSTLITIKVILLAIHNKRNKKAASMSIQLTTLSTIPESSGTRDN